MAQGICKTAEFRIYWEACHRVLSLLFRVKVWEGVYEMQGT